jgi:hypothetical protein
MWTCLSKADQLANPVGHRSFPARESQIVVKVRWAGCAGKPYDVLSVHVAREHGFKAHAGYRWIYSRFGLTSPHSAAPPARRQTRSASHNFFGLSSND